MRRYVPLQGRLVRVMDCPLCGVPDRRILFVTKASKIHRMAMIEITPAAARRRGSRSRRCREPGPDSKTTGERATGPLLWSGNYRSSVRLVPAAVLTAAGLR